MNEERKEKLDYLEDLISNLSDYYNDYYLSNEDNPYADYCTWGFTESEGLRFDDIDDEDLKDACERLVRKIGKKEADRIIPDYCSLQLARNLNTMSNELYSIPMGETEIEPSDEITNIIEYLKLSDDDVNKISGELYYKRGMFYENYDYNRWCLILDASAEEIETLIKERN